MSNIEEAIIQQTIFKPTKTAKEEFFELVKKIGDRPATAKEQEILLNLEACMRFDGEDF